VFLFVLYWFINNKNVYVSNQNLSLHNVYMLRYKFTNKTTVANGCIILLKS